MNDPILTEYQVRKTNSEKTKFIEYMKSRLSRSGYHPETDITIEEKGKGIFQSRNIVVGNPKTAKILMCAHYDTCAVLPFPNFMAPTNPVLFIVSQIFLTALIFAMAFVFTLIFTILTNNVIDAYWIILIFLYTLLFYMMFGYRNKHTANDNTSGTITITRILEALPQELRDKVCVIYFDNEEKGLLGSEFFRTKHKNQVKDKLLLNFDCVGDGKEVVFLAKKKAREDNNYKLLLEILQECVKDHDVEFLSGNIKPMMFGSDQMHFEKGVGVCALRKSPFGRYVARIHTPFDTKCREENIMYLVDGIQRYLAYLYNQSELV